MPLLFLFTYIAISYFMFKKNKQNIKDIPFIIKLTWIIPFALLFLFIIYYSEQNIKIETNYIISFYFLLLAYITIFIIYLFKYRRIIISNKIKLYDNKWVLNKYINNIYLITIISFSLLYFIYADIDDLLQILLYLFFVFSWIYIIFEKKILN